MKGDQLMKLVCIVGLLFSFPLGVKSQAIVIPNNSGGNPFYFWAYGNSYGTTHMRVGTDYGHQGDAALEIFQHETNPTPPQPGKVIVNGLLGIGTMYPTERLSVNGNIKAREVNVTVQGWADYVFDESYPLLSLSDLEIFLKKNKHLPDVPTEEDVLKNGIWLSELNVILLKKIEELTLYLILQDKKIEELSKEKNSMEDLLRRVEALEKN